MATPQEAAERRKLRTEREQASSDLNNAAVALPLDRQRAFNELADGGCGLREA
jgi:hypothetical protein